MPVAEIADTLLLGRSTVYRALNGSGGESREHMTSIAIDRVWSIRDAVLKWLYLKAMVNNSRQPVLEADDIANTVEWQGDPLTQHEVEQASDWLLGEGYLSGSSSWGHGVGRPSITARGEALADAGRSVRGGNKPADPQGMTTIHISNSTNVAIDSPGTTQTYTMREQATRAIAVADALEGTVDGPAEVVADAQRIATEIKAEAAQPEPNSRRLKELIMSAVTTGPESPEVDPSRKVGSWTSLN
jgi:hypothetical protein